MQSSEESGLEKQPLAMIESPLCRGEFYRCLSGYKRAVSAREPSSVEKEMIDSILLGGQFDPDPESDAFRQVASNDIEGVVSLVMSAWVLKDRTCQRGNIIYDEAQKLFIRIGYQDRSPDFDVWDSQRYYYFQAERFRISPFSHQPVKTEGDSARVMVDELRETLGERIRGRSQISDRVPIDHGFMAMYQKVAGSEMGIDLTDRVEAAWVDTLLKFIVLPSSYFNTLSLSPGEVELLQIRQMDVQTALMTLPGFRQLLGYRGAVMASSVLTGLEEYNRFTEEKYRIDLVMVIKRCEAVLCRAKETADAAVEMLKKKSRNTHRSLWFRNKRAACLTEQLSREQATVNRLATQNENWKLISTHLPSGEGASDRFVQSIRNRTLYGVLMVFCMREHDRLLSGGARNSDKCKLFHEILLLMCEKRKTFWEFCADEQKSALSDYLGQINMVACQHRRGAWVRFFSKGVSASHANWNMLRDMYRFLFQPIENQSRQTDDKTGGAERPLWAYDLVSTSKTRRTHHRAENEMELKRFAR